MLEILRNMTRRKARTGLTVFGIVVGIFALTIMGSMTEYFNSMIENAVAQAGTNIGIAPKGGDIQTVLTPGDQKKIERVAGVRYVLPSAFDTLGELGAVSFGATELIWSEVPELAHYDFPRTSLKRGRWLQRGDMYHAVIGSKIASKRDLDLGGTIEYRDRDFSVVGIMNETQSSPDTMALVPLDIMRRLLKAPDLIMAISVVPQNPLEVDALAARIQREVDTVTVTTPEEAIVEVRQALGIFNAILMGGAVMAVLVGGLAVINTMIMSVTERIKEIGLKKAIGASDLDIIREYLSEAIIIGLVGGVIGFLLGSGLAALLNSTVSEAMGASNIFTVTPRLALLAVLFAVGLGGFAGLYPALVAARLDPVRALRSK